MTHSLRTAWPMLLASSLVACAADDVQRTDLALVTVECASADAIPESGWICNDARTLECGEDATLFVVDAEPTACAGDELHPSNAGPFEPGTHTLIVSDQDGSPVCASDLTVVDTLPPVLEPRTVELWPPNHALHTMKVEDCVSVHDACEGDLHAEFVWASSDEPGDALGDGHHAPDIGVSPDASEVCMRSERQGPEDGRVYRFGVRVVDASGNEALGECTASVPHDQGRGIARDSGEAYRVTFDDAAALPGCDD